MSTDEQTEGMESDLQVQTNHLFRGVNSRRNVSELAGKRVGAATTEAHGSIAIRAPVSYRPVCRRKTRRKNLRVDACEKDEKDVRCY